MGTFCWRLCQLGAYLAKRGRGVIGEDFNLPVPEVENYMSAVGDSRTPFFSFADQSARFSVQPVSGLEANVPFFQGCTS